MHIAFKQLYKQAGVNNRFSEVLYSVGHFKDEAQGQPLFHNRESVNELKKRFQR